MEDILDSRWSPDAALFQNLEAGVIIEGSFLGEKSELRQLPDVHLFYIRADYGTFDSDRSFSVMAETPAQALWLHMLYEGEIIHEDVLGEIEKGNISSEDIAEALDVAEGNIDWSGVIVWEHPISPIPGVKEYNNDVTKEAKKGYEDLKAAALKTVNAPYV